MTCCQQVVGCEKQGETARVWHMLSTGCGLRDTRSVETVHVAEPSDDDIKLIKT